MSESLPDRDNLPADEADLDAYLDESLSGSEQAARAERHSDDAVWQEAAALQRRIDEGLATHFPSPAPSRAHLEQVAALAGKASGRSRLDRRRRALLAAAAVAAVVGMAWLFSDRTAPHRSPFFEPTPLAAIYRDAVAQGFEPYYECREPQRLTAIFERRLDASLHLLPMPPGSRMLGLSYPGGLSRDTTAMLCRVDGEPVMVLVDRRDADRRQAAAGELLGTSLHLHRVVRDRLVFYEVSPFDQPRAMQYLVATTNATPAT